MPVDWCIFLSDVIRRVYKYLPSNVNHDAPLDLLFLDSCYSLSICDDQCLAASPLLCLLPLLLPLSCVDQSLVTSPLFYRLASPSSSLLCRPASSYVLSSIDLLPVTSPFLCRPVSCYFISLLTTSLMFFLSFLYRPVSCYILSLLTTSLLFFLSFLCRPVSCYLPSLLSTSFLFFLYVVSTSFLLRPLFYRPTSFTSPSCVDMSLVTASLFYRLASCSSSFFGDQPLVTFPFFVSECLLLLQFLHVSSKE